MKTPKQKAEDLVWKFGKGVNKLEMSYIQAKECALIAVNEIIDKDGYNNDYWNEVKQEIEKL